MDFLIFLKLCLVTDKSSLWYKRPMKEKNQTLSALICTFKSAQTRLLWVVSLLFLLAACQPSDKNAKLQQIKKANVLKVGILFNPTSYYVDIDTPAGFEHDLVQNFAEYLDVEIELIPSYHVSELLPKLENGTVDILVGGLTPTKSRSEKFRYSPPYLNISQKVVFKQGRKRPNSMEELDAPITVAAQTSHYEKLLSIADEYPNLKIEVAENSDPNEILEMVMDGSVDYTIAVSHNLSIVRRYFPDISVAFTVEKKQQLSWLNYVDTRLFMRAVDKVLPKYKDWFEVYAGDIDWRLLAAQSYQESHWDPKARSPTGVRGIMMLTQPTAKQFGVESRLDPEDNIRGGSVYLRKLLKRIPDRISEHDRPWFALAAYNIGWGHVQDARRLTSKLGGNPDKWVDVKKQLPLLRQKRYYKKTRYGFARGDEAVNYVSNIRRYYDTLVWIDQKAIEDESIASKKNDAVQENKIQQAL